MFRNQLRHKLNLDKWYETLPALPIAVLKRTVHSGFTLAQFVANMKLNTLIYFMFALMHKQERHTAKLLM